MNLMKELLHLNEDFLLDLSDKSKDDDNVLLEQKEYPEYNETIKDLQSAIGKPVSEKAQIAQKVKEDLEKFETAIEKLENEEEKTRATELKSALEKELGILQSSLALSEDTEEPPEEKSEENNSSDKSNTNQSSDKSNNNQSSDVSHDAGEQEKETPEDAPESAPEEEEEDAPEENKDEDKGKDKEKKGDSQSTEGVKDWEGDVWKFVEEMWKGDKNVTAEERGQPQFVAAKLRDIFRRAKEFADHNPTDIKSFVKTSGVKSANNIDGAERSADQATVKRDDGNNYQEKK